MRVGRWSTRAMFALSVACLAFLGGLPAVSPSASPAQAQVAGSGSIGGTVTDNDGMPLAGVEVGAQGYWDGWFETVTDSDGEYEFTGLPADDYSISFTDPSGTYAAEYYDSVTDWNAATWLEISDGVTITGVDATLEPGGRITGTILDEAGNPFATTRVCVVGTTVRCDDGAADGTYEVGGLATGDYYVAVDTWEADGTFRSQWYDGVHGPTEATLVPVTLGQASGGVDFVFDLTLYGTLAGRVIDQDGNPFDHGWVCVDGPIDECDDLAADGTYSLGLLPGDYRVSFTVLQGDLRQYYNGSPGGTADSDHALPVTVAVSEATSGIDAVFDLSRYGAITGTVLQPDGSPFVSAWVCVQGGPSWNCSDVASDGSYVLRLLEPGEYLVYFGAAGPDDPEAIIEYYDGVDGPETATPITVVAGQTVTGIDARYAEHGSVEGVVTGPGGSPVEGALVGLFGPDDRWLPSHVTETDNLGQYLLSDVAPGDYRMVVVPPAGSGLAAAWHTTVGGSATIEVHAHQYTTANQELVAAASITGTLVDPSDNPVDGVTVRLLAVGSPWVAATTVTADDGSYGFDDVQPGDYQLRYLVSDESPVASGWFDGVDAGSEAQVITIGSGDSITADQELRWARSLSGVVTGPGAEPVEGAVVRAYQDTDGIVPTARVETAADGTYRLVSLPRGQYRIQVTPPAESGLSSAWFDGTTRSTARVVEIGEAGHQVADVELVGS